jgi:hypothetical protein
MGKQFKSSVTFLSTLNYSKINQPEGGLMKIKRDENQHIMVVAENGGYIQSQSVEANLLYEILQKLEEIRCGLIDIETAVYPPR